MNPIDLTHASLAVAELHLMGEGLAKSAIEFQQQPGAFGGPMGSPPAPANGMPPWLIALLATAGLGAAGAGGYAMMNRGGEEEEGAPKMAFDLQQQPGAFGGPMGSTPAPSGGIPPWLIALLLGGGAAGAGGLGYALSKMKGGDEEQAQPAPAM